MSINVEYSQNCVLQDISKLIQIHGVNSSFLFLTRLGHHGIYTMVEVDHLKFPNSIEVLQSLVNLRSLKFLLAINDVFWR
ncbi:hypothetical protein BDB01DRAFT_798841 [Pilobolus umbonatus]|nr:hypothetical protein BDB01DRAFT_798841 [Pilobolus umbonatus]